MSQSTQKLTTELEAKGASKTTDDIKKVGAAQKEVVLGQKDATSAVKDKAGAQEKLNAAEGDYIGILSAIHPALGTMVDAMLKGTRVAGDMATKEIKLGKVISGVTGALGKHKKALAFLAARGAAVAAIAYMISKWKELEEQIKAAAKAQEDFNRQSTGRKEAGLALEDEVLKAIDQRRGEVGTEARRQAVIRARNLIRFRGADQGAAVAVGAATAGEAFSADELEVLAQGVAGGELDISKGLSRRRADMFFKTRWGREAQQEAEEWRRVRAERAAAAARQLDAANWVEGELTSVKQALAGGPTAELERLVEQVFGGEDPAKKARMLQQLAALQSRVGAVGSGGLIAKKDEFADIVEEMFSKEEAARFRYEPGEGPFGVLERELEELRAFLKAREGGGDQAPIVIHHHHNNYNERNYGGAKGKINNGAASVGRTGRD